MGLLGRSRASGNASGGSLLRAASRQRARSDYEEHQIVLLLQAVERMKEMVQVGGLTSLSDPHLHGPCKRRQSAATCAVACG